jgi:hypothetical protein
VENFNATVVIPGICLLFMGTGSVWFSKNYFNENTKIQLEEKMSSSNQLFLFSVNMLVDTMIHDLIIFNCSKQ